MLVENKIKITNEGLSKKNYFLAPERMWADIIIAFHDGVVGSFMDTSGFHTKERWLEESFWASESFIANRDNLSIR